MTPNTTPAYSSLVGTPYEKLDCWGIAKQFYKLCFGIVLNDYYSEVTSDRAKIEGLIRDCKKDFDQVTCPEFGDLILIRMRGLESHIAVYLGRGKILHTQINTGCVVDSLARWEKMVVGFYRVRKT